MINSIERIHCVLSNVLLTATLISCVIVPIKGYSPSPGYTFLWLMPYVYLCCLLWLKGTANYGFYLSRMCFEFYSYIRYSLIPLLSTMSGIYNGETYLTNDSQSIKSAILLMCFEVIAGTAFFVVVTKSNSREYEESDRALYIKGSRIIYWAFILLASGLYFVIGRRENLIQFGTVSSGTYEDVTSSFLVLIRQIIRIALFLIFLLVTDWSSKKYERQQRIRYFLISLAFGVVNIITIVGQRRAEQLSMSIIVIVILIKIYPRYKKMILLSIISVFVVMMVYLTLYKNFLQYGMNASINTSFSLEFVTRSVQAYFGGIQNMAETIVFASNVRLRFSNLLFDVARSIFGISFVLKGNRRMTIELFNSFIYGRPKSNGHVLSSTGYSMLFFTPFLCFLCLWFNLFVLINSEKIIIKTNSFEVMYIFLYVFVRFGMNLFAYSIALLNYSTMILGTVGLLYLVASHIRIGSKT